MSIPVPELQVRVADTLDADPNDRLAWFTIGRIEGSDGEDGGPKDLEFQFIEGGESYLNGQMGDEDREFLCAFVARPRSTPTSSLKSPRGLLRVRFITGLPSSILRVRHPLVEELENASSSGDDDTTGSGS